MQMNYSDKAVSRWERGDSLPDISVLLQLCEFYGVEFDWLIHRHDNDSPTQKREERFAFKLAVTLLWAAVIFTVATIIFVYNKLFNSTSFWPVFVWAGAASLFCTAWLSHRWWRKICASIFLSLCMWATITAVYVTILQYGHNIWPVFLIGIPAQAIAVLLHYIRMSK